MSLRWTNPYRKIHSKRRFAIRNDGIILSGIYTWTSNAISERHFRCNFQLMFYSRWVIVCSRAFGTVLIGSSIVVSYHLNTSFDITKTVKTEYTVKQLVCFAKWINKQEKKTISELWHKNTKKVHWHKNKHKYVDKKNVTHALRLCGTRF